MNKQPDKLFRNKLHGLQRPVSPDAWKRVSENLDKKNKGFFWLRIAAAILLCAVAGLWIIKLDPPTPAVTAAKKIQEQRQPDVSAPLLREDAVAETADIEKNTDSSSPVEKRRKSPHPQPANKTVPLASAEILRGVKADTQTASNEVLGEMKTDPTVALTPAVAETPERKSVTIIFSAEEVNAKYYAKSDLAEATPEAEKTSTLKKLLVKAHDLKHNQDPLGDLRQKKNEILALNFKGDKQRNN